MPPSVRSSFLARCLDNLAPGGTLILEAFSKNQLGKNSGGPKDVTFLYDLEDLTKELAGHEFVVREEREIVLDEGAFHSGAASVIRVVMRKHR